MSAPLERTAANPDAAVPTSQRTASHHGYTPDVPLRTCLASPLPVHAAAHVGLMLCAEMIKIDTVERKYLGRDNS